MKCCHGHALSTVDDPRFEGDEFTQAALRERRARAAHAHAAASLLSVVGGLLFFGLVKSIHRHIR
ncbi:MAG: hypothetical protein ACYC1X_03935 [Coriobacteriia bacterium]